MSLEEYKDGAKVFDVRTASVEDIALVFGVSLLEARVMQLMERGEYEGDIRLLPPLGIAEEASNKQQDMIIKPRRRRL